MKKILICITGSIAAIKIYDLIKELKKDDYIVQCILSKNGEKFVSNLALESISKNKVVTESNAEKSDIYNHISLSVSFDLLLVAPATANIIANISNGFSNTFITSLILARGNKPLLVAPAMNRKMLNNIIVQNNLKKLKKFGIKIIPPQTTGFLACGEEGEGKMATIDTIKLYIKKYLSLHPLENKNVLINTGSTKEYLDPIRYIANDSSGLTGKILSEECFILGAKNIVIVHGASTIYYNSDVFTVLKSEKNYEMKKNMQKYFDNSDIIILSAAVSDFKFKKCFDTKIKKQDTIKLEMEKSEDLAKLFSSKKKTHQKFIGFALETENNESTLTELLKEKSYNKNFDIILGNKKDSINSIKTTFFVYQKKNHLFYKIHDFKKIVFNNILKMIFNN
jgi:phosphopantothenoylcysteine decarboxylase/phosphopantothenate--cysteine ligase